MDELEALTADEERLLEMALLTLEEPEFPEGFAERLSQRLRAEQPSRATVTVLEDKRPASRHRWWMPVLLAAAAIVLFFGFLGTSKTQSAPIGVVAASEGKVKVDDSSVEEAVALKAGMKISTEPESPSILVLAEATEQIRLDSETTVTVNSLRQPRKDSKQVVGELGLKKGRVWISEKASKVAIRTPHALLLPVGTEYEAITGKDATELVVWEGEVIARSLDGLHSRRVSQGEELVLNAETWTESRTSRSADSREASRGPLAQLEPTRAGRQPAQAPPAIGSSRDEGRAPRTPRGPEHYSQATTDEAPAQATESRCQRRWWGPGDASTPADPTATSGRGQ